MANSAIGHSFRHLLFVLVMTYSLTMLKIGLLCKNRKILSESLPGNSFVKNSVKSGVHGGLTIYTP